jgi:hypothetical protein
VNAFEALLTTIIMIGMIVVPISALVGTALERNWRGLGAMVLFLLLNIALGAGLVWWIRYLTGR